LLVKDIQIFAEEKQVLMIARKYYVYRKSMQLVNLT